MHHDFGKTLDQARRLDRREEFGGGDDAAYGMCPTRQCFEATEFARVGRDLRLEPGCDLTAVKCGNHVFVQCAAGLRLRIHLFGKRADTGRPPGLRLPQGDAGGAQPIGARAYWRTGVLTEPDANTCVDHRSVDRNRLLHRALKTACLLDTQFKGELTHRADAHCETRLSDMANEITFAHRSAQPITHPLQHRVSGGLAIAVDHFGKIVDFYDMHTRQQACLAARVENLAAAGLQCGAGQQTVAVGGVATHTLQTRAEPT